MAHAVSSNTEARTTTALGLTIMVGPAGESCNFIFQSSTSPTAVDLSVPLLQADSTHRVRTRRAADERNGAVANAIEQGVRRSVPEQAGEQHIGVNDRAHAAYAPPARL